MSGSGVMDDHQICCARGDDADVLLCYYTFERPTIREIAISLDRSHWKVWSARQRLTRDGLLYAESDCTLGVRVTEKGVWWLTRKGRLSQTSAK